MLDKVRLIYNKIENRIDEICDDGFVLKENQQEYETLTDLEDFINSFPKEPTSESLEEAANFYANTHIEWFDSEGNPCVMPAFKAGTEWQKEKYDKQFGFLNLKDCKDAYNEWKFTQDEPSAALAWVRACEWQKQKDLEDSIKSDMTMPNKFYEKGRFDMREEMMKDAVEGEVVYQIGSSIIAPTDVRYKVMSDRVYIPNVKLGDKVKIIICKTEQQ